MRKSTYVTIGALAVTATLLAVAACIALGAFSLDKRKMTFETYLEGAVQGVSPGSPVKFRGFPVGQVEKAGAAWRTYRAPETPDGIRAGHYARIVFSIAPGDDDGDRRMEKDLRTQIEQGLRVSLKSRGIAGGAFLDIDYFEDPPPLLPVPWRPRHDYIPSAPGSSKTMTDALLLVAGDTGRIGALADSATRLVDELGGAVGSERVTVQAIVGNIERATRNLADALERIKDDPSLLLRGRDAGGEEGFE